MATVATQGEARTYDWQNDRQIVRQKIQRYLRNVKDWRFFAETVNIDDHPVGIRTREATDSHGPHDRERDGCTG